MRDSIYDLERALRNEKTLTRRKGKGSRILDKWGKVIAETETTGEN